MKTFDIDPTDKLDYVFEFEEWLGEDSLTEVNLSATGGLTLSDISYADGKNITVWVSGGTIEVGKSGVVSCAIVTAQGRNKRKHALFIGKLG